MTVFLLRNPHLLVVEVLYPKEASCGAQAHAIPAQSVPTFSLAVIPAAQLCPFPSTTSVWLCSENALLQG